MKSANNALPKESWYALIFGGFLGLTIWKFGNPVILDTKVVAPISWTEYLTDPWPPHWVNFVLLPLAVIGAILIVSKKNALPRPKWLWVLPLVWLGWQFISASQTVDGELTATTLWQFFGCLACYFLGIFIFSDKWRLNLLFVGILLAFTYCLVQAVEQKRYEFPQSHQVLVEGQKNGWTNFTAATISEMKIENIIITTNGSDIANPVILTKFAKGRVYGTLVYPNALAGLILMLLPASIVLAIDATRRFKPLVRFAVMALTLFLGVGVFFWTGSKLGWLLGLMVMGAFLLRLDWALKLKITAILVVLTIGLTAFAIHFRGYFAAGATSVSARFDYWRAAVQTTVHHPVFGTGPGTFQRPYARIKSPDAEMARLAHNDYLEQFSDSGVVAGVAYLAWVIMALWVVGKKLWQNQDAFLFALFTGLLAWFVQGFGEFSLYVPALAWMAFTLLGSLIGIKIIEIDKKPVSARLTSK